ncbi:MAG TPA: sigma-70 family RNA polymerase sigma factor [Tepidisphaeraceae bacterium]
MNDIELLQRYLREKDQQAFAELVGRHLAWVYSAALRQVGDAHLAEAVTQGVFLALVRQADKLTRGVVLTGWLFGVTRCAAAMALRSKIRRDKHEQQAAAMNLEIQEPMSEERWRELAPLLDELVEKLGKRDRVAVLLRFYQRKSFAEIGEALGVSEEAARKRVGRAVEKLRGMFAGKGMVLGAGVLAGGLLANVTQAAPVGLGATVVAAVTQGVAVASGPAMIAKGAMKMMAWAKIKIAAAWLAAVLVVAGGAGLVLQQTLSRKSQAAEPAMRQSATQPTTRPDTSGYGPLMERELVGNNGGLSTIDLDTGERHAGPTEEDYRGDNTPAGMRAWLKRTGIDAVGAVADRSLLGFEMVVVAAGNEQWDIVPADLMKAVSGGKAGFPSAMKMKENGPTTWFFRTREGGVGVLQVIGLTPDGQAIKFRYKLVRDGSPATQSASSGKLDFRIAAEVGEGDKPTGNLLPRNLAEQMIRLLKDQGPQGAYERPSGFDWFEATDTGVARLVSGTYENRRYVLLMNREPYTMLAEQDGRRTWGLKRVYLTKDNQEHTAIGFDFDAAGAERFGKLTETSLNRPLAILIDGKVVSAPKIMSKITGGGDIDPGNGLSPDKAQDIVAALAKGMPPTTAQAVR